jgi:hypothetical protein
MSTGKVSAEEAADDLVDRIAEIGAIAQMIDRALSDQHGENWDAARLAVCGMMRLASLASDRAMALSDRVAPDSPVPPDEE